MVSRDLSFETICNFCYYYIYALQFSSVHYLMILLVWYKRSLCNMPTLLYHHFLHLELSS